MSLNCTSLSSAHHWRQVSGYKPPTEQGSPENKEERDRPKVRRTIYFLFTIFCVIIKFKLRQKYYLLFKVKPTTILVKIIWQCFPPYLQGLDHIFYSKQTAEGIFLVFPSKVIPSWKSFLLQNSKREKY